MVFHYVNKQTDSFKAASNCWGILPYFMDLVDKQWDQWIEIGHYSWYSEQHDIHICIGSSVPVCPPPQPTHPSQSYRKAIRKESKWILCMCWVIPKSLWPHGQLARLLCLWNFPGKNTGVVISFSRVSSQPRDWTPVSCISSIDMEILYRCTTWEALILCT